MEPVNNDTNNGTTNANLPSGNKINPTASTTTDSSPTWRFGSSSIGVLKNVSTNDLTFATRSLTDSPSIAAAAALSSNSSTTTSGRAAFGSSIFGGSTQPLGFGTVNGTTAAATSGWATTEPFTTSWTTTSSSPTAPTLTFRSIGGFAGPTGFTGFGTPNSSALSSTSQSQGMFSGLFSPSSSSSSGVTTAASGFGGHTNQPRPTTNWFTGVPANPYADVSREDFRTPINWTPVFSPTESFGENAAAYSERKHDEWHQPIEDVPSSTPTAATSTAVSSAPSKLTPDDLQDLICAREFHRFILRVFHFYHTPGPFIHTHLIQLLSQLGDRVAQCYLTILLESHQQQQTTPVSSPDWLMDQPIKNSVFKYAHQQVAKAEREFQHKEDWNQATHITRNLVHRWLTRFQTALPHLSSSSGTNWLMEESNPLRLAAFVQGVLECFVYQLSLVYKPSYSIVDLWNFLNKNRTYSEVWRGLRCEFKLNHSSPTWIPLATYQLRIPPLESYEAAFNIEHSWIQEHMNKMNASSWYMEPKKLAAYAEQFALDQLRECPLSHDLRVLGVRPLQFWISLPNVEPVGGYDPSGVIPSARQVYSYVSLLFTDSIGQEFRLLYGRDPSDPFQLAVSLQTNDVLCLETKTVKTVAPWPKMIDTPIQINRRSNVFKTLVLERLPVENDYYQHLLEHEKVKQQFRERFKEAKEVADRELAQTHLHQISQGPRYQSSHFQSLPCDLSTFGVSPAESFNEGWRAEKLERIFTELQPITYFSLFGPTLYEDNQPIKIKRQFHSLFMDACLIADGLVPLPKVLNELISDYYTIPIPFIPQEAEEQMRPYSYHPSRDQLYQGRTDNPVESSHLTPELGPDRFFTRYGFVPNSTACGSHSLEAIVLDMFNIDQ